MNSQPNITRAMNNLEAELDCKLFFRSHTGVTLTPEGEMLHSYISAAHKQIQLGEAKILSAKNLQKGHISIGFSIGITEIILHNSILPILHHYHLLHPEIRLQIVNESTPKLISDISNGLIDLAVVTTISKKNADIHETILESFQDILIGGPAFSKLCNKKVNLTELVNYPFINLWSGTETYNFYSEFFASHGLKFEPAVETATTDQILSFVINDMGIGFVSPEYAKTALENSEVFKINLSEKLPLRNISLIRNNNTPINVAAAVLEDMICDSVQLDRTSLSDL